MCKYFTLVFCVWTSSDVGGYDSPLEWYGLRLFVCFIYRNFPCVLHVHSATEGAGSLGLAWKTPILFSYAHILYHYSPVMSLVYPLVKVKKIVWAQHILKKHENCITASPLEKSSVWGKRSFQSVRKHVMQPAMMVEPTEPVYKPLPKQAPWWFFHHTAMSVSGDTSLTAAA